MQQSYFSLHALKKTFLHDNNTIHVLNGINKEFYQGESYVITGASGVGKSTLLHIIAGLEKPTAGYVAYNNQRIDTLVSREKQRFFSQEIGLVFQTPYLLDQLSVLENVIIKGLVTNKEVHQAKKEGYSLLERVGLADKAELLPYLLSGGQQQRIALARALFNKPTFLLADEPTGNLDKETAVSIIDLVLTYQQEYAMGLIISSHDSLITARMNKKLHLKDGFLCEE